MRISFAAVDNRRLWSAIDTSLRPRLASPACRQEKASPVGSVTGRLWILSIRSDRKSCSFYRGKYFVSNPAFETSYGMTTAEALGKGLRP